MAEKLTLVERIREELKNTPNVTEKRMFGSTAFLVNDKMCVSADAHSIMCRVDPALHDAAIQQSGCTTVVMQERQYRGYIDVQAHALPTKKSLSHWIDLALEFNKLAKSTKKKK